MHKASFGLAVAVGLATSCFFAVGSATADPYKWCAQYAGADSGGGTKCGFVTLEQCRATIGGMGGLCITFATSAGGTLQLDASIAFGGLVAGFGLPDSLDLRDISYISGTTSETFVEAGNNLSGTLMVTDGTHTANLTLLGQYATGNFTLASDGHGGTLVTDPPLAVATDQQSFLSQPRQG